jgi:hypothetical protein
MRYGEPSWYAASETAQISDGIQEGNDRQVALPDYTCGQEWLYQSVYCT